MVQRAVVVLLCAAATACHEAAVVPVSPPDGVTVSLTLMDAALRSGYDAGTPIVAAGDSIVVNAAINNPSCPSVVASAGMAGGTLVLTMTSRAQDAPAVCPAVAIINAPARAVLRPVPSGRYSVVVRRRYEGYTGGTQEQELVRGAVTVP